MHPYPPYHHPNGGHYGYPPYGQGYPPPYYPPHGGGYQGPYPQPGYAPQRGGFGKSPMKSSPNRRNSARSTGSGSSHPVSSGHSAPRASPTSKPVEKEVEPSKPSSPPPVDEPSENSKERSPPVITPAVTTTTLKPNTSDADEEEDLISQKVLPMQSDFHFYAMAHKAEQLRIAQDIVRRHTPSSTGESEAKPDPCLVITALNERLMKCWEGESAQVRLEYFAKEEEDRRRFMTEDEIASRHCATLTARAKSPKTGKADSGVMNANGSFSSIGVPKKEEGDVNGSLVGSKRLMGDGTLGVVDGDGESPTKKSKDAVGENTNSAIKKEGIIEEANSTMTAPTSDESESNDSAVKMEEPEVSHPTDLGKRAMEEEALESVGGGSAPSPPGETPQDEKKIQDRVVESILERRTREGKEECLVRWKGLSKEEDSWEAAEEVETMKQPVEEMDDLNMAI